ncbi:MAG: VWA domain-containing protein [Sulfurimonas sp.]|nr:VWA domain-containing protein [Sulfurimonas sp.]
MNIFTFEYPYLIFLLLPLLYCLYKCKEFQKPIYFVHLHFMQAKKSFKRLEWIVKILIFVLLCIALSSPIIIDRFDPQNRDGKDIVLSIDASGSMNSSGFDSANELSDGERLSRFELSKRVLQEFINARLEDNIGIVVFGDFAFIASPITYEKEILSQMLAYLTQGMAGQNTAIGESIAMSVRAFKHSKAKTKIIILLTDGEHNSGAISPKEALEEVKTQGIKIYTIAMGNKGEADEALLEKIAKESGGEFFRASNAGELQEIYAQIDTLESSKIKSRQHKAKEYYYHLFLFGALALLVFLFLREMRR